MTELTGGHGPFIASAMGLAVPDGFVVNEYVASGIATDYEAEGTLGNDGRWRLQPSTTAAYRTRVLVRRPADPATASGTVVVEWLNVSSGYDSDPVFAFLSEEIVRRGHVWVGVSAQIMGVEGGTALLGSGDSVGLVGTDAARYGSLSHPGDGYAFDIFTQVARTVAHGGAITGGIVPRTVIAAGESQSAFALTTYYDGVQPLALVFDGFFVHSRASGAVPLVAPGTAVSLTMTLFSRIHPVFRDDLEAPVMNLQAEGDVTGYLASYGVRQPDSDVFRLWEVAGTAHADQHLLGDAAAMFDCGGAVNDGAMHVVAKAAFHALETWTQGGAAPPMSPRLEVDASGTAPAVMRDADGIALGGLRTPPVDVPVDVLSGVPVGTSLECMLFGSTAPLSDARIAMLYTSRADYQARYAASVDATIGAGLVLEDDRAALEAYAQPERVGP